MSPWRKKLFALILLALIVMTFLFWGTMIGGICLFILIQSIQVYLFSFYANTDLAKTFQEDGKHIKGWR